MYAGRKENIMAKKNYKVTLTDTATYIIKTETKEEAICIAAEWFSEREPDIAISVTD